MDDESSSEEEEEEEESSSSDASSGVSSERTLRVRAVDRRGERVKRERRLLRSVVKIRKKAVGGRTREEEDLLRAHPRAVREAEERERRREQRLARRREVEDPRDVLEDKCRRLADAIRGAEYLVAYTGAGISTAADIPDYRGPNGVWTRLDKGLEIGQYRLERARPTLTHMALFALFKKGKLKHAVSQNCDGLHMRSGIPRYALSEVHGNMFIEICKRCKPMRPFVRLFDVTERTSKNRHATSRRCYVCGSSLYDTIVHFGERGSLKWPINWDGASKAADRADVILCLGSSLKVLRRYPWLWSMDKPKKRRPELFIVNLQWTPKDGAATLKLNGKCDAVLKRVFQLLDYRIPDYYPRNDPLLSCATRLNPLEEHTTDRRTLVDVLAENEPEEAARAAVEADHNYASEARSDEDEPENQRRRSRRSGTSNGRLVASKRIDYKSIVWPGDALYLTYENKFEFLEETRDGYPCDCCDPAKRRKRARSSSEEEEDDDSKDGGSKNSEDSKEGVVKIERNGDDSTNGFDNVFVKKEENGIEIKKEEDVKKEPEDIKTNFNPGWFGKGRKKKTK